MCRGVSPVFSVVCKKIYNSPLKNIFAEHIFFNFIWGFVISFFFRKNPVSFLKYPFKRMISPIYNIGIHVLIIL